MCTKGESAIYLTICGTAIMFYTTVTLIASIQASSNCSYYSQLRTRIQEDSSVKNRVQREIRVHGTAIYNGREGLGAILSKLRPVLMVANVTGAIITGAGWTQYSDHKYEVRQYLRIEQPLPGPRKRCEINATTVDGILSEFIAACDLFNKTKALSLFDNCELLHVRVLLPWYRTCARYTAPLVRAFWRPPLPVSPKRRTNICVWRRGGDVERFIDEADQSNMHFMFRPYAIQTERTLPVLRMAQKLGIRTALFTVTKNEDHVRALYKPDILSNDEPLLIVIERAALCKCSFVTSGSSFAHLITQLIEPEVIIYTHDGPNFKLGFVYQFEDFGPRAMAISTPVEAIIERCLGVNANSQNGL